VEGIRHNNVEGVASGAIVPDKYLIPFLQGDLVPADHVIGDAGGQVDGVKEEGGIGAIYDFCRYAEIGRSFCIYIAFNRTGRTCYGGGWALLNFFEISKSWISWAMGW
jgi:hypothetical protein